MAEEVKKQKCSDLRTFGIAFVTAVMVVALYHLGLGLIRIYCPECSAPAPSCQETPAPGCQGMPAPGCQGMPAPQPLYILVPVNGFSAGPGMCPLRGDGPGKFGRGEFRRFRGPRERGMMPERFDRGPREGKMGMKGPRQQNFGHKSPRPQNFGPNGPGKPAPAPAKPAPEKPAPAPAKPAPATE